MRSCQLQLKSPLLSDLLPVHKNLPIEKCSPSVVSCLKCGDELWAMFLVADWNLQMRHWAQGTAECLEQHWSVTLLSNLSTAPGFISKMFMVLLHRNLAPKIFAFICLCIETFDSLVFKFSLEERKSVKIRMEIIYDLQFEWNNYWSFQIVQSQQCSGQEHEAYMYTC